MASTTRSTSPHRLSGAHRTSSTVDPCASMAEAERSPSPCARAKRELQPTRSRTEQSRVEVIARELGGDSPVTMVWLRVDLSVLSCCVCTAAWRPQARRGVRHHGQNTAVASASGQGQPCSDSLQPVSLARCESTCPRHNSAL